MILTRKKDARGRRCVLVERISHDTGYVPGLWIKAKLSGKHQGANLSDYTCDCKAFWSIIRPDLQEASHGCEKWDSWKVFLVLFIN